MSKRIVAVMIVALVLGGVFLICSAQVPGKVIQPEEPTIASITQPLELPFNSLEVEKNKKIIEEKVKEKLEAESEKKQVDEEVSEEENANEDFQKEPQPILITSLADWEAYEKESGKADEDVFEWEKYQKEAELYKWEGSKLTRQMGVNQGPCGKETYYNLPMQGVVKIMRGMECELEYSVREDKVKMLGPYVMVAASLDVHDRGDIVPTSLGLGIVCDTGTFAQSNPNQLDIAVDW